MNVITKYIIIGFLIGLLFPFSAYIVDIYNQNLLFTLRNIWKLHLNNPIHFILNSIPFVISFIAYFVGNKVNDINKQHKLIIEQQLYELQTKNKEMMRYEVELRQNNEELYSLNDTIDEQRLYLKTIIESQGEGFAIIGFTGEFLFYNPVACEIFGVSNDELIGRNIQEFLSFKEWNVVQQQIEKRKKGIKDNYELTIDLADNVTKKIIITGVPHYNNKDQVIDSIIVFRDITQSKINEQIVIEKTRQFENTINNMEDIYFKTNLNGDLLEASPSICKHLNYSNLDEIIQNNVFDQFFINKEIKDKLTQTLINTGKLDNYSFKIRDKCNNKFYGETNIVIWYGSDNEPKGFEGIIRNVGERVKFEKELNRLNGNLIQSLEITNKQKDIIELANREITDNIKYAERIQHAIFPSLDDIDSILKNNFILWKPFNIISGDFYWVKQIYNKTYVAVGDCTGHGVSGALLSMLGCSLIEDIVSNQYFEKASHILNILQEHFEYKFRNHVLGTQISDGMDISICIIDYEHQKLHFSAANHELIYIRNDEQTIIKGDKMCIGKQDNERISFTEHIIDIQDQDLFYMFSDGFASQFGGENDKKYSKKRFKNTLMNIHHESLSQQKNALQQELEQWMAPDYPQIDDILVLGFQI